MKKILFCLLTFLASSLVSAAPTTSTIVLAGGGEVPPAGILSLPLDSLLKDVYYNLSCQVTNPQVEPVDMRFEPGAGTDIVYGQVSLNETILDNQQGSLQSGSNTLTVHDLGIGKGSHVLQFKNLDFNHRVEVSNCVARPAIHTKLMPTSGSFIAYNDTSAFVEIKVGNFFPTPYTISPHSSRWIFVSTDNQNIKISKVF